MQGARKVESAFMARVGLLKDVVKDSPRGKDNDIVE